MSTTEKTDWVKLGRTYADTRFHAPSPDLTPNRTTGWNPDAVRVKHDLTTELGHARAFMDLMGGEIAYVANEAAWYVWDTHRWVKDERNAVRARIADYAKLWASNQTGDKPPRPMMTRVQSLAGINAIAGLAAFDPRTSVSTDDFDRGVELLNTPAGVLNLRTGETASPDPRVLVKRSTAIAPDFTARRDLFDETMESIFKGDPAKVEYIQRQLGITLLGAQPTQQFMYLKGSENGADGKTVLMGLVQSIIGEGDAGYATTSDRKVFEMGGDRHAQELAKLAGARMVVTSEIGSTRPLDTDKIKGMVAGDRMTARFMRENEFEFVPQFMLWVMSNHHAKADATDGAFWRRASTITFDNPKKASERIGGLADRLFKEEGPAILAWMVEGAQAYLEDGFATPDSVIRASEEYKAEMDTVASWVDNFVTPSDGFVPNSAIRESYVRWCKSIGSPAVSVRKVSDRLEVLGFPRHRGNDGRGHDGLSVKGVMSY